LRIPPSVVSPAESGIFQPILSTGVIWLSASTLIENKPVTDAKIKPKRTDFRERRFMVISPMKCFMEITQELLLRLRKSELHLLFFRLFKFPHLPAGEN
jgi:hypothetical protein